MPIGMKFGMSTWGMRGMLYIIYVAFAVFFLHVYLFLFMHKHWLIGMKIWHVKWESVHNFCQHLP